MVTVEKSIQKMLAFVKQKTNAKVIVSQKSIKNPQLLVSTLPIFENFQPFFKDKVKWHA